MDPVERGEQRVRELVNVPRRQAALLQNKQSWIRLCSAMDAIGDTQMAIRSYLDDPAHKNGSDGRAYLLVYGILQVLYVQQDAVGTLSKVLNIPFTLPAELEEIRDIRNDSIGHPTGRGGFISRITLS